MKTHIIENFRLHATAISEQINGMHVVHTPAMSWVDSGFKSDTYNIVFIRDSSALLDSKLQEVQVKFDRQQAAYCCWVPADQRSPAFKQQLENCGLNLGAAAVGMGMSFSDVILPKLKDEKIERVETRQQLTEYARVIAANWSPPDGEVLRYFRLAAGAYLTPPYSSWLFIYRADQQVVSTVELFAVDQQTAGIYGLCTLEAFRKRGIGTKMMSFIMHFAQQSGFENLILHASEAGLGIYQRLGFQTETYLYEYG